MKRNPQSMRFATAFILAFILSMPALAQHQVTGRVVDDVRRPLAYAHVVMLNPADSTLQYFDVTDSQGIYEIKHIKAGIYLMQYSYVTKSPVYQEIIIPPKNEGRLGDQVMKAAPAEAVVVEAEYVPIQFKQDTVAFNAKAFKTKAGAVVEDLLKKIPGVEVDNSGNVKALGEDVTQVLVDGKEFFGNDAKVATKNLPARSIDKVQIFDKQSEDAEFSGINDGVQNRTINLLLNEDNKKGYFGNVKAGGGTNAHYQADGKLYRFSSTLQSAVLGMVNNVNEFGFSGKGHGDFGQDISGLNKTAAGGINLSLNTRKPNRYFISYLAHSTKTALLENTSTEHFIPGGAYFQHQDLNQDSRNTPHKINMGIRHQFNDSHKFTLDGDVNIDTDREDRLLNVQTLHGDTLINSLESVTESQSDLLNASFGFSDIIKFNQDASQVQTKATLLVNRSTSELNWQNATQHYAPAVIKVDNQFQDNIEERVRMNVNPTWVQRLRPFWYLDIGADLGSDHRALDKEQGLSGRHQGSTDSLSAELNTLESWIRPGVTLRRATAKSQISLGLKAGFVQFEKTLHNRVWGESNDMYFLPHFKYTHSYQTGRRIALHYWTGTQMPSLNQLLPLTNALNPLVLYRGDMKLKPEYKHNMALNWSVFDHFSFTSLFTSLYATYTTDKISLAQTIHEDFSKTVRPVNVEDDLLLYGMVHVSTPIRRLGVKISVGARETYRRGISLINGEENRESTCIHQLNFNVENRRKDLFHLRLGGSVSLTRASYSLADQMNHKYYNTTIFGDFQLTPSERWSLEAEADIVNYNAESFEESVSVPLIKAGINYNFLRGNRATLSLTGYDLLNKYTHFQRISNVNTLVEKEKNTIGRYVMLTLKMRTGK